MGKKKKKKKKSWSLQSDRGRKSKCVINSVGPKEWRRDTISHNVQNPMEGVVTSDSLAFWSYFRKMSHVHYIGVVKWSQFTLMTVPSCWGVMCTWINRSQRLYVFTFNPKNTLFEKEGILLSQFYRWESRHREMKQGLAQGHTVDNTKSGFHPRLVWLQSWCSFTVFMKIPSHPGAFLPLVCPQMC